MSSKNRTLRICKHQTKSSPKENKLREREREELQQCEQWERMKKREEKKKEIFLIHNSVNT